MAPDEYSRTIWTNSNYDDGTIGTCYWDDSYYSSCTVTFNDSEVEEIEIQAIITWFIIWVTSGITRYAW